ncbi:MAG: tetratricopeptide repeat protein, partial [Chloroflexi bacterium]|nr:tetratricopeptide repeat protein [Chloroflexota bacterium]
GLRKELSTAYDNVGWLHQELGEYDLALKMYERSLEIARGTGTPRTEAMALSNIGDLRLELGLFRDAIDAFEGSLAAGTDVAEPRIFCLANIGLGSAYCELGDFQKARFHLEQAKYEAHRMNLKRELGGAILAEGTVLLSEGRHEDASDRFQSAVSVFLDIAAIRPLARAYIFLGETLIRLKKRNRLSGVVRALEKLMQNHTLADEVRRNGRVAPRFVAHLAAKGRHEWDDFESNLNYKDLPRVPNQLDGTSAGAYRGISTRRIQVRTFGRLQVTLDGHAVPDRAWGGRKSQELFLYLLINRAGKTREQLLDSLWGEAGLEVRPNAFYNLVYRIRRALSEDASVIREGHRYRVSPHVQVSLDLDEFRRLSNEARTVPKGSRQEVTLLERANSLYAGEFLIDFYSDWIVQIRHEVEAQYLSNLSRMTPIQSDGRERRPPANTLAKTGEIGASDLAGQKQRAVTKMRRRF